MPNPIGASSDWVAVQTCKAVREVIKMGTLWNVASLAQWLEILFWLKTEPSSMSGLEEYFASLQ